ncbi:hypothetical protein IKG13_00625 [Candidatus Saccharibacteria bacterium]|nr:hypothetical protein [Candidatus Saccharibacteria bacterium]
MEKIKHLKNKRVLAIAIPAIALIVIGGTIAVNRNRISFANDFKLAGYETLFTETFDAPQNWKTCETIDKTITATNDTDSSGPVSIRIKLEEQWLAADGTTELPLVSAASGLTMAQINFTQNSGWTKDGAYYYYDTDLAKGATTSSLITGVTLNCNANLSVTEPGSDGVYADGTYHLKITAQAIDADSKDEWRYIYDAVKDRANPDTNIDFTKKATIATGNGNGVNRYTENGQDVYYFRGEVNDNNVIWADKCWKIVRTTATGGTKMIYNGLPTTVDGAQQCNATGVDSLITVNIDGVDKNSFNFSNNGHSPSDVGYMYGTRIELSTLSPESSAVFTFSNDVSRNGNTYTLDTSAGQSISGTWMNKRTDAAVRYHYFCTDGAISCDNTKIGYIYYYGDSAFIWYLNFDGYNSIEDAKTAMFANTNDSNAKVMIETWFEQQNLDGHIADTKNYEDDLEDAVFCNDRSYYYGALKGKDSNAMAIGSMGPYNWHGAYGRIAVKNSNNNYEPSLDCSNIYDAFTKDSSNGNGKLRHEIGLITADELTMAGIGYPGYDATDYLYVGKSTWSASPGCFGNSAGWWVWNLYASVSGGAVTDGLRPLVSLKSGTKYTSGTGLKTDPYIVE